MPKVEDLTNAELRAAVTQMFDNTEFRRRNRHLTTNELRGLRQNPRQWPVKPVFHPYVTSHDGYGQGKSPPILSCRYAKFSVRYNGTKYLCHRLTYREYHGALQLGLDVSHVLLLGKETA